MHEFNKLGENLASRSTGMAADLRDHGSALRTSTKQRWLTENMLRIDWSDIRKQRHEFRTGVKWIRRRKYWRYYWVAALLKVYLPANSFKGTKSALLRCPARTHFRIKTRTYSSSWNTEETNRHQHSSDGNLVITKLNSLQVLNTQCPCRDETIKRQNLVHLNRSNEGTSTLSNDIDDCGSMENSVNCDHAGNEATKNVLATTFDNFEVNGAATEASPNLIWGTSWSSSILASWSVMDETSNCRTGQQIQCWRLGRNGKKTRDELLKPHPFPCPRELERRQVSARPLRRGKDRRWLLALEEEAA